VLVGGKVAINQMHFGNPFLLKLYQS